MQHSLAEQKMDDVFWVDTVVKLGEEKMKEK